MHHSIDTKSVLIGALSAALVLCLIAAVPYALPEEYGRFEIATSSSHAFVLDSATGQVWSSGFAAVSSSDTVIFSPDPNFHAIKTDHGTEVVE